MKKFIVPYFAFIAFTSQAAYAKRCNFALRGDDCCDLQFK